MSRPVISRREFLKLAGLGLASLLVPGRQARALQLDESQQGRVADPTVGVYEFPTFESERVKLYWRDLVLPITGMAVSDDEGAYNRVWYLIGDEGYAYSGAIQPVRTALNEPSTSVPRGGILAEVTVPFTDARAEPDPAARFQYRMYYETTHWVDGVEPQGADGEAWYRLFDDKFNTQYYVPARHLRLLGASDLTPISANIANSLKSIEVRLSQQLLVAYEGSRPVFASRVSTGARYASGNYATPPGVYKTYHKRATRHMAAGDLASNGYDLPGVPWVLYIKENGISLHGTYWHNDFGRARSHGCINLPPAAARWVYRWTQPSVPSDRAFVYKNWGTTVNVVE